MGGDGLRYIGTLNNNNNNWLKEEYVKIACMQAKQNYWVENSNSESQLLQ